MHQHPSPQHRSSPLPAWQRSTLAAEQRAEAQGANARIVYLHARPGGKLHALATAAEARLAREQATAELLCRGAVAAADHDIEGAGLGDFSQASTPMPLAPAEASTELGYLSGTGTAWRRTRRYKRPLLRRLWAQLRPGIATAATLISVLAALGLAMHSDYHELILPQALLVAEDAQP
jgi:hypothetical protein